MFYLQYTGGDFRPNSDVTLRFLLICLHHLKKTEKKRKPSLRKIWDYINYWKMFLTRKCDIVAVVVPHVQNPQPNKNTF